MRRDYRASGLGGCIKAQVAAQLGFTPLDTQKKMENLAREGHMHELAVMNKLFEDGYEILDRQREVVLPLLKDAWVVGHLDACTFTKGEDWVIEVKSMGKDQYKEWKEKGWMTPGLVQKYKWQVSCYMHGMNYPLMFVVKNRNSGEMDISWVEEPFYGMDDVLARVLEIEKWVRRGELPDECSVSQYPCPFYYLEQQKTMELTEDAVMDDLVEMYDEAKVAVKAAEERLKAAREAIKEGMGTREKVETEHSKVTTYQSKRRDVDHEKMREDGIEVDKYVVEKIFSGVRVTRKEEKDGRMGGSDESRGDGTGKEAD